VYSPFINEKKYGITRLDEFNVSFKDPLVHRK